MAKPTRIAFETLDLQVPQAPPLRHTYPGRQDANEGAGKLKFTCYSYESKARRRYTNLQVPARHTGRQAVPQKLPSVAKHRADCKPQE
eukprot:UN0962